MRGEYPPLPPEAGWGEETPKSLHAFLLWLANPIPANLQALIRRMARDNATWGEERIANELRLKLGLRVSPRTVRKYLPKRFDRAPNHGIPFGQKTQTYCFPSAYGFTITHFSPCIPPWFPPYSPLTKGNNGGGLTHEVEATAGLYHEIRG
jgi:hypothetical protein